jgi:hypothetical protein
LSFYACGEADVASRDYDNLYVDSDYETKPIICMAIMYLATYNAQLFRNILYKILITTEVGVWFERQILFNDYWFSALLLIYEEIMLVFYFRRNRRRGNAPLYGFPYHPPAVVKRLKSGIAYLELNTKEEVNS